MSDFTPGPWKWQSEGECLVGPDQVVMRQDDEGRISFADYPDGTTQANARLIAAAPDLLAACEALLRFAENTESELGIVLGSADSARAAITKAKGGAE